jgi:cyanate permease
MLVQVLKIKLSSPPTSAWCPSWRSGYHSEREVHTAALGSSRVPKTAPPIANSVSLRFCITVCITACITAWIGRKINAIETDREKSSMHNSFLGIGVLATTLCTCTLTDGMKTTFQALGWNAGRVDCRHYHTHAFLNTTPYNTAVEKLISV